MSFAHSVMLALTKVMYKPYDPAKPKDYIAARKQEMMVAGKVKPPVIHNEITFAQHTAETFTVDVNPTDEIICYIHGGGFVGGSAASRRAITSYVAANWHYNVISLNYDLAPEVKFPTGHEQCYEAYKQLVEIYGAKNIVLMGESGGGNILLSICLMAKDRGMELPACLVPLSPSLQYSKIMDSYKIKGKYDYLHISFLAEIMDLHFGSHDPVVVNHPYASPMYGNYEGFPPTFILSSADELLCEESQVLYDSLKKSGVDTELLLYPKMMHAFAMFPHFPESKKALTQALEFVNARF